MSQAPKVAAAAATIGPSVTVVMSDFRHLMGRFAVKTTSRASLIVRTSVTTLQVALPSPTKMQQAPAQCTAPCPADIPALRAPNSPSPCPHRTQSPRHRRRAQCRPLSQPMRTDQELRHRLSAHHRRRAQCQRLSQPMRTDQELRHRQPAHHRCRLRPRCQCQRPCPRARCPRPTHLQRPTLTPPRIPRRAQIPSPLPESVVQELLPQPRSPSRHPASKRQEGRQEGRQWPLPHQERSPRRLGTRLQTRPRLVQVSLLPFPSLVTRKEDRSNVWIVTITVQPSTCPLQRTQTTTVFNTNTVTSCPTGTDGGMTCTM